MASTAAAALAAAALAEAGALHKPEALEVEGHKAPGEAPASLMALIADTAAGAFAELGCFCLAFAVIYLTSGRGRRFRRKGAAASRQPAGRAERPPAKTLPELQAQAADGRLAERELGRWAGALLELGGEHFLQEAVAYLRRQDASLVEDTLATLMDAAARASLVDAALILKERARDQLGLQVEGHRLDQCMVAVYAATGNDAEVQRCLQSIAAHAADGEVPMRTYSVIVRGCLASGRLEQAARYLSAMNDAGHEVPQPALVEFVSQSRRAHGDMRKVTEWFSDVFPLSLPAQTFVHMIDECFELATVETQVESAALVEHLALSQEVTLPLVAYEKLLRIYARTNNSYGAECVRRMDAAGHRPCARACTNVMSRCADSQNVPLAESVAALLKSRSEMNLVAYKTFMKVYAYAGMYDKACDLYHMVLAAGLEPDATMYGSLMKFSAKVGRIALSQELLRKSEGVGCVKTCLWTIRSAGQQGDVKRAMDAFEELRQSQPRMVDGMAYNIVIDACCSNKDMGRAIDFAVQMEKEGVRRNRVTFNTLIKGYCVSGDLPSAKRTMVEMEEAGFPPDAASYSCILSCAAKAMDVSEMWAIIAQMDSRDLSPDSYIVAIMMQASRKAPKVQQAMRMLAILDRPDVKICEDEVVFNCVLDACIARRDRHHLDRALREYNSEASKVRPTTRTYGLMIKACAVLGRTQDALAVWNEMLRHDDLRPNDITLGCAIDALVEGRAIDEALALFQEWKGRVKYDTIIYSTLIKGFASIGDADRAMALYQDMKTEGIPMNHIVFTSLITAYARVGNMKPADGILEEMLTEGCKPNAITYSVMIRGHCVRGDLPAALEVLQKMVSLGFPADCVIFNTLLDGCVRSSNWDLAETLLEEMGKQGVERSNFTVSIIVKMWSKRGDLDKAFETVYDALKAPHVLSEQVSKRYHQSSSIDTQVGSCIVGACIHNKDPERALKVFRDMKTWPNFDGPDANTYGAMICGLAKHGYLREATSIAEEACVALRASYDRKMVSSSALMQLFRALKAEGTLGEVGPALGAKLRAAGMVVEDDWLRPV